jgi:sn-glycerol 3-phosphate transport system substrate-binding protein
MSRLLALALAGVLAALVGCGGGGEEAPAGAVHIDFWHSEPAANEETLQRMVARFNASQDEVEVRAIYQGGSEETVTKLIGAAGSGEVPAAAFLTETYVQRIIDGHIATPVQQFVDREAYNLSDLDQKLLDYHTVEGTLWAMPICVDMPLLYYNKNDFRDAGLDPDRPPADLEELRQDSQQLLRRDSSGTVTRTGLALDIKLWPEGVFAQAGQLLVNENNGRDGRATEALLDSEAGRYLFPWWHDMVSDGLAINVGRNPTGADSYLAVATGRAAMTFGYAGALRSIVTALEEGSANLEVGVGALPGPPGGTGSPLLLAHAAWIFGQRPEREQEAAWKFLSWLAQPEQQAEWFAGSGCMPVSRSSVDLPAAQEAVATYPLFRTVLDLYLQAKPNPAALAALAGPLPAIRDAIFQAIEAFLAGERDPLSALEQAADRANEELRDYNERVD